MNKTEIERAAQLLIDYCRSKECIDCEFWDEEEECIIDVPAQWVDRREKNGNQGQGGN